jgi:hypothetical protein
VSLLSIAFLYGRTMRRFDGIEEEASSLERLLSPLPSILMAPMRLFHSRWVSEHDLVEWLLVFSNSLLWGGAVAAIVLFLRGRRFPDDDKGSPPN